MLLRVRNRVKAWWAALALLSVELLISISIFFVALLAFAWLVRRVFVVQKTGFDARAFEFLGGHVNPIRSEVMEGVTFLGTHYFLIPLCISLVIWFLLIRPHKWYSITVPVIAISSVLLMLLLKQLFERPRPLIPLLEAARGFSFPSGHALMSTTVYGLIIYIISRETKPPVLRWALISVFILLILAICLSRIYLRVHYTSDVLAGISLGIAWLILSITIVRRMQRWGKRVGPELDEV
jgi:membrane-associated phospholipid phosphatase